MYLGRRLDMLMVRYNISNEQLKYMLTVYGKKSKWMIQYKINIYNGGKNEENNK